MGFKIQLEPAAGAAPHPVGHVRRCCWLSPQCFSRLGLHDGQPVWLRLREKAVDVCRAYCKEDCDVNCVSLDSSVSATLLDGVCADADLDSDDWTISTDCVEPCLCNSPIRLSLSWSSEVQHGESDIIKSYMENMLQRVVVARGSILCFQFWDRSVQVRFDVRQCSCGGSHKVLGSKSRYEYHSHVPRTNADSSSASALFSGYDALWERLFCIAQTLFSRTDSASKKEWIPKSVLLYGVPGTGKTSLVRRLCASLQVPCITSTSTAASSSGQRGEQVLEDAFALAKASAPCVLFLDEVDGYLSQRGNNRGAEHQLASHLESLRSSAAVFVVLASNIADSLGEKIRRPGRIDIECELAPPNAADREKILRAHMDGVPCSPDASLQAVAADMHGFVGADIALYVREAVLSALAAGRDQFVVTAQDLSAARSVVGPSALRELRVEVTKVRWHDVGGMEDVKECLTEVVEWPLRRADTLKQMGLRPPKGVLLYGPPGCSKTLLARALATESTRNFIAVRGPEVFSKWVGESERSLRRIFNHARQNSPCILFFDEIDALGRARGTDMGGGASVGDRVLSQFLHELDGIVHGQNDDIIIIGATNRPDVLDSALLRPGRLDRLIYVGLPEEVTRRKILDLKLANIPVENGVDIAGLAHRTDGYTGAELDAVAREACLCALRRCSNGVQGLMSEDALVLTPDDFDIALEMVTPRTDPLLLDLYGAFRKLRSSS